MHFLNRQAVRETDGRVEVVEEEQQGFEDLIDTKCVECKEDIDAKVDVELAKKEDKNNLTINRKLDEVGDFKGTLCNGSMSACEVVSKINNNEQNIEAIIDGNTSQVIDGGYFGDPDIREIYDGGVF